MHPADANCQPKGSMAYNVMQKRNRNFRIRAFGDRLPRDVYRKLGTDSAMAYIKVKASLRAWKYDRSATRQEYILSVGEAKQT